MSINNTNNVLSPAGGLLQMNNSGAEPISSSAGKTSSQGPATHSNMVPIPMASSSGGTDYADYKDFYKYQQQQQQNKSNTQQQNNSQLGSSSNQGITSGEQMNQVSQNTHLQTTPMRSGDKDYNFQNNSQNNTRQYNNQYDLGGNTQSAQIQKINDPIQPNKLQNDQIFNQSTSMQTQNTQQQQREQTQMQNNLNQQQRIQQQNMDQQNFDNNSRQQLPQSSQQQLQQQINQKPNNMVSTPVHQKIINPQQQQQEEVEEENLVGVIKIKDGLFICDEYGAQDLEFIISNKVTKIVNTAGMQLNNHWDNIGVQYLTLNWQDDEKQVLFDEAEKIPDEIYNFMNDGLENHESVLIKSEKAQNRACFVICAFIMRRYRWSMLKTLEFINSRRQDLVMRPAFLKQLQMYENKLFKRGLGPKTQRWTEIYEVNDPIKNDELILRNTYLNSQQGPWAEFSKMPVNNGVNGDQNDLKQNQNLYPKVLKWRDEVNAPFSQLSIQNNVSNNKNSVGGGSLSFICGSGPQILGASLKTNVPQQTNGSKLSICQQYAKENDLLQQAQPQKQQNHMIFHKDSIQMKRNITPILRKKGKQQLHQNQQSLSATKNIIQIPGVSQPFQAPVSSFSNIQGQSNKENQREIPSQLDSQKQNMQNQMRNQIQNTTQLQSQQFNAINQQNKINQNIQMNGKSNDQIGQQQRVYSQNQNRNSQDEPQQFIGGLGQRIDDKIQNSIDNVRSSIQAVDINNQNQQNNNISQPNYAGFGKQIQTGIGLPPQPQLNNFMNQTGNQPPQYQNPSQQNISEQYQQQQQSVIQMSKEIKQGHKSAQIQEQQTSITPSQQRSSSTRVKPNSSQQSHGQSASANQAGTKSSQRINSSLHGRDESNNGQNSQQNNSSSAQRLAKLTQQNISQPRRREPTSRVAPKNQVSSNPQGQIVGSNNDTSILSTSMNNGSSVNNGVLNQQSISSGQKTNQARLNSNRQNFNQPNTSGAIQASSFSGQSTQGGSTNNQANNSSGQPAHPSKKQQLRYQQQLNGRGYSPSYNNLIKDQNGQIIQQHQNQNTKSGNHSQANQSTAKNSKQYGGSSSNGNQGVVGHSGSSHTPTHMNASSTSTQKKQINSGASNTVGSQRPGSAPKQIQTQQQHHHNPSTLTNGQNNHSIGIPSPIQSNNFVRPSQQQISQISKNSSSAIHSQNNQSLSSQNNLRASIQQQQLKQQGTPQNAQIIANNLYNQQNQKQPPSSLNTHHMMHTSATVGAINSQNQNVQQMQQNGQNNQIGRGNTGSRAAPISTHHQLLSNNNSMVIRNSNSLSSIQQKNIQQQNQNAQPSPHNMTSELQSINQQEQYQNQVNQNGQQNASKSILSSFRNGPIKILGGNQSSSQLGLSYSEGQQKQIQLISQQNNNMNGGMNMNQVHQHQIQNSSSYNRMGMNPQPQNTNQQIGRIEQQIQDQQNQIQFRQAKSSQVVSTGSDTIPGMPNQQQPQINGAIRPGSAPSNKRPPSPGQLATQNQSAVIQQQLQIQQHQINNPQLNQSNIQNQQAYFQQQSSINQPQQPNRVKYPKQLITENQTSNNNSGYTNKQIIQNISAQQYNGMQSHNNIQINNTTAQSTNHKLIAQNNNYSVNRPSSSNSAIGSSRGILSASIQQQQQQQSHLQGPHLSAQQPNLIGNPSHTTASFISQQQNIFANSNINNSQNQNLIKSSQPSRMFQQQNPSQSGVNYHHQGAHHFGPQIQQNPISPGGGLQPSHSSGYNNVNNKISTSFGQNIISNSAFQNKHINQNLHNINQKN